jgi:hypothetical protein
MKFRLLKPHYIRVRNREDFFEQKETLIDGIQNETKLMRYPVDRYLDPNDASQWNFDPIAMQYRRRFNHATGEYGWLVVTTEKTGHPLELVIKDITTEMEGIDDAAQAVIEKLWAKSLGHPIDNLPATFGEDLSKGFGENPMKGVNNG